MGMFDHVSFEMPCPKCGSTLDNFQSKDGPCQLDRLDPKEVFNMYCKCDECGEWVELSRTVHRLEDPEDPPIRDLKYVQALGFVFLAPLSKRDHDASSS